MKETYNRIEFEIWVLNHKLHLLLKPKEMKIFLNNKMRYQDLKLFGQLEDAELLTKEWLRKNVQWRLSNKQPWKDTWLEECILMSQ